MTEPLHVVPLGDLIDHHGLDCPCGPTLRLVPTIEGAAGQVVIHHSLDGRETQEAS